VIVDIGWDEVVLRLALASVLTGAIGFERELRERAAGLRTHLLVGLGAALFTLVSAYGWQDVIASGDVRFDPSRVAAQIVTGIGFLGAGAILRQGLSVRGLTTAAGLWVSAAVGMACGAGFYSAGLVTTAIALVALGPFRRIERWVNRVGGDAGILEVHLTPERTLGATLAVLERERARIHGIEFDEEEERRWVRIDLEFPRTVSAQRTMEEIAQLDDVLEARWHG
jgi:putative Mg2+ transporter-C (MgtC) family protein